MLKAMKQDNGVVRTSYPDNLTFHPPPHIQSGGPAFSDSDFRRRLLISRVESFSCWKFPTSTSRQIGDPHPRPLSLPAAGAGLLGGTMPLAGAAKELTSITFPDRELLKNPHSQHFAFTRLSHFSLSFHHWATL